MAPNNGFTLKALARSPAGRGQVRLEWEAKPLGTAFSTTGHVVGPAVNTGAPVLGVGSATTLTGVADGLLPSTPYHWRVRVLNDSPFFPRSPWFSPPYNGASETDLRTSSSVVSVSEPVVLEGGLRVEMVRPNPSGAEAEIRYTLPRPDHMVLWVHDLQGRRVATLVEGVQEAGPHAVSWNGRNQNGKRAGPGVYWVRLRSGGEVTARKFIRE